MSNKYNLNITKHHPLNDSTVSNDTNIEVWLSVEINKESVDKGTFYILNSNGVLIDSKIEYNPLEGKLTLVPGNLLQGERYSVHIDGIRDLDGDKLNYSFSFNTSKLTKIEPPRILQPLDNSVVEEDDLIVRWQDLDYESYVLEIAEDIDFENLVVSTIIYDNSIKPNISTDNTYYIRAKVNDRHLKSVNQKQYNLSLNDFNKQDDYYNFNLNREIETIDNLYTSFDDIFELVNHQKEFDDDKFQYKILNKYNGDIILNIPNNSISKDMDITISVDVVEENIENNYSNPISFYYKEDFDNDFDDIFELDKDIEGSNTSLKGKSVEIINTEPSNVPKGLDYLLIKIPEVLDTEIVSIDSDGVTEEISSNIDISIQKKNVFGDIAKNIDDYNLEIYKKGKDYTILRLVL